MCSPSVLSLEYLCVAEEDAALDTLNQSRQDRSSQGAISIGPECVQTQELELGRKSHTKAETRSQEQGAGDRRSRGRETAGLRSP